jgi:hypothetical protein
MALRFSALILLLTVGLPGWLTAQNIVSNPGFEIGEVGGLPEGWSSQKEGGAEGKVILTKGNPHTGRRCLLIEHTNSEGYIHPNKDVEIDGGNYIFRFWARSDKDLEFVAQIYRTTDWSTPVSRRCRLKEGRWTKFEFFLSFEKAFPGSIQIGLSDILGRLWLDDVELIRWEEPPEKGKVQIWDTRSPFDVRIDVEDRTAWRDLPPSEAKGHPFRGDAVIENGYLTAAFTSKKGELIIYSRIDSGRRERVRIIPLQLKGTRSAKIASLKVLQATDDKAVLEARFSGNGEKNLPLIFSFSGGRAIEIKPGEAVEGISFLSAIRFAVVPSFIGDDLIFDPEDYPSAGALHLPSENLLLGLLEGEDGVLVITYSSGRQEIRLIPGEGHLFESVDLENDGKPVYLAILDAPGIWHREELKPSYLERDIAIDWRKPFPAKWITQLYEDGVKTTYYFQEGKGERIWRAGIGWYTWPVWFEGERAVFHLSKRIPPVDDAIIYFLERDETTPFSVTTPLDILKETLNRQTYDAILDSEGRLLRPLMRENAVIGAATCGVTDKMEPIFKAGKEVEMREYIEGGVDDMVYFIRKQRERINEYLDFAREMMGFLNLTEKADPDLKPFLSEMKGITQEIFAEYERAKESIKTLEYADELAHRTKALARRRDPKNLQAFLDLKMKWRGMGGAQDDLVRKFHTITRKLFQEAGYSCVNQPEAVEIAKEIRERCKRCLRNPDGYEIWPNY